MMGKIKIVNIEYGLPTVEQACIMLGNEIVTARAKGFKALKIIHGYGSSGIGGGLKEGIQKWLSTNKRKYQLKSYITGEEWNTSNNKTREVLGRFEYFRKDSDVGRNNPGITIVVL